MFLSSTPCYACTGRARNLLQVVGSGAGTPESLDREVLMGNGLIQAVDVTMNLLSNSGSQVQSPEGWSDLGTGSNGLIERMGASGQCFVIL